MSCLFVHFIIFSSTHVVINGLKHVQLSKIDSLYSDLESENVFAQPCIYAISKKLVFMEDFRDNDRIKLINECGEMHM